eukprot:2747404-Pyramimonas_sp.AAC.1
MAPSVLAFALGFDGLHFELPTLRDQNFVPTANQIKFPRRGQLSYTVRLLRVTSTGFGPVPAVLEHGYEGNVDGLSWEALKLDCPRQTFTVGRGLTSSWILSSALRFSSAISAS